MFLNTLLLFYCIFYPIAAMSPYDTLLLTDDPFIHLKYNVDNENFNFASVPFTENVGHIKITKSVNLLDADNYELQYNFTSQAKIALSHLEIQFDINLEDQVMMAEGFQCWSTTREMDKYSKMSAIPGVVSWFTQFNLQGDYDFFNYSGKAGHIHSNGYTYFRNTVSNKIIFIGSLSEDTGYTYYKSQLNDNKFSLYKDIDGKLLESGQTLVIKVLVSQRDQVSGLRSIWELYADYYDPKHEFRNPRHLTGWSSWYNFYESVTEADVVSSLNAFKQYNYPIDVFQIDDGFESQIGDWLDIDKIKFPRGMKVLADSIKEQNYIPGIWLAPYAVGFNSKIVKDHPDWLLKNSTGGLVVAGPNWGGFYAMDIYHPEVRTYLQNVFDTVIDIWGFKLIKLDFLFAAAMIPRLGKSRGEIMWDAMDLITELTHKRALLLGSGVTLPSTWGRLEYSRVSSDASPWWDNSILRISNVRERVGTSNSITSTLNRWPMASTVFGSDPDVFFVRSNNNQLTKEEKHTLLVINIVFGQLVLMSDNVGLYNKQEHKLYSSVFPKPEARVTELISVGHNAYQATYTVHGREYLFITNLSPVPFSSRLPWVDNGHYFEHGNVLTTGFRVDWLAPQTEIFLMPHETRAFMKITKDSKDKFMGSTGNIVPGSEIETMTEDDSGAIHITLRKPFMSNKKRIFIKLNSSDSILPNVYVDDNLVTRVEKLVWDGKVSVAKVTLFDQ